MNTMSKKVLIFVYIGMYSLSHETLSAKNRNISLNCVVTNFEKWQMVIFLKSLINLSFSDVLYSGLAFWVERTEKQRGKEGRKM